MAPASSQDTSRSRKSTNQYARNLFRGFTIAVRRTTRFGIRHPKAILGLTGIAVALSLACLPHLKTLLSIDDLVDESFQAARELNELKENFPVGTSAFVAFNPRYPSAPSAQDACRFRKWLSEEAARQDALLDLRTIFGVRRPLLTGNKLLYPEVLSLDCDAVDGLPQTFPGAIGADSPWKLILTDRNQQDLSAEFLFADPIDLDAVGGLVRSAPPGAHWSGNAIYQYFMLLGIQQMSFVNMSLLLFLALLIRALFGTWKASLLYLLTLVVSEVILHGLMAATGAPLDVLSSGLFLMVAVSSLEDFIFLSHEQLTWGTPWRSAFGRLSLPSLLTSLTTVVGFGSLCVTDLEVIRRFGFWAAIGALLEWGATFVVLPALASRWPAWRVWANPAKAWKIDWQGTLGYLRIPRKAAWILLGAYLIGGLSWKSLKITDAPIQVFASSHVFRKDVEYLKAGRGWEAEVSLVFPDGSQRERNEKILAALQGDSNVATIESPYHLLDYLSAGLPSRTQKAVIRELEETAFFRRLISPKKQMRAIVYLKESDTTRISDLRNRVEALCAPSACHLAGSLVAYSEFGDRVPKTLLDSFGVSMAIVALILGPLAWVMRVRPLGRTLAAVFLSSFWGPFAILAVLLLFRINVNFLTCVFGSALVGLTGDNAIQFLLSAGSSGSLSRGMEKRSGGAFICGISMALASLFFLGSQFYPARVLGTLLAGGLILALFGDTYILRAILPRRSDEHEGLSHP